MNVGVIGLGKLGLPVAVSMDLKGHNVMGYDIDPTRMTKEPQQYKEAGPTGTGDFNDWLKKSRIRFGTVEEIIEHASIIFVAVQTPHDPIYEGVTPLPSERKDFDYTYLEESLRRLNEALILRNQTKTVVIISTCLPGTVDRITKSMGYCSVVYNPFFIAMGTTMRDFLNPEFILMGVRQPEPAIILRKFYGSITDAPVCQMSIASAELTKVSYNTYISTKIAFANTVMEICDHIPSADCDDVIDALSKATTRLISPAYMRGGMGDGGGCHPRDNIAMSWLADELGLSHNLFDNIMMCRENQTKFLVKLVLWFKKIDNLQDVYIMGYSFKPETNLIVGSPALLLANLLREKGVNPTMVDPIVDPTYTPALQPGIYVIGCRHEMFQMIKFPKGSVVIDPHRYIPDQEGVTIHRIGEAR